MRVPAGDTWVDLTSEQPPLGAVADWAVRPDCGALVLFAGTARDHAEGRPGVTRLEYEAYEEQVVPRLAAIADEARRRWPVVGRIALIHRVGEVPIGEASVIAAVSSPHRPDAFAAARFCIEALKAGVPIWKRETWSGGDEWSSQAHELVDVDQVDGPR
ncbi:MAG: molybdenum cofactor biosynthesis protein MoaE [Acidimicrobiales bacterium]